MSYSSMVKVVKRFCDLLEEPPANSLLDLSICALLLDILVKRNALNVISDNTYLLACFYQIIHFNYVRMVDLLQSHDLTLNCFSFH